MDDYAHFRSTQLAHMINCIRTEMAGADFDQALGPEFLLAIAQLEGLLAHGSPDLPVTNLHHHPEVRQVSGLSVTLLELLVRQERLARRPILNPGYYVAERIGFPQWEQIPDESVRSNCEDPSMYELNLFGQVVRVPVKYLLSERYRSVDTADEARDYRRIYQVILDILAAKLALPPQMVENLKTHCLASHNMRKAMSKSVAYRRWQESGGVPTFYDVVGMYVLGLGRWHKRFRRVMEDNGLLWMAWAPPVHPLLAVRPGQSGIRDAPVKWNGDVQPVQPYRQGCEQPWIEVELMNYDNFGHWVRRGNPVNRLLDNLQDAIMDVQELQQQPAQVQANAMDMNQPQAQLGQMHQVGGNGLGLNGTMELLRRGLGHLSRTVHELDDAYGQYKVAVLKAALGAMVAMALARSGLPQAVIAHLVREIPIIWEHCITIGRTAVAAGQDRAVAVMDAGRDRAIAAVDDVFRRAGYVPVRQVAQPTRGMLSRMFY
ncbi:hypothetical protein PFICI_14839 [Pestalotiopsis fici W106-1]|uniref:Uncharacterized protein n=1 Tax=Pestalotiopsis fici (strain W106-1 / CGMCC3.15140) TaxID=1229662 RepID=W3WHI9_PESFW|nr:uncharacterized protein PFICI_14839 [Pestalotiopsis fici W106-1]ETS73234.1 hypothetical protein PFICI_14839 [Pestalotiopsis fici W106-1]